MARSPRLILGGGEMMGKEWVPTCLRESAKKQEERKTVYGIGRKDDGAESYGMTHGPTVDEIEMLEIVPEAENSFIFRFNSDWTEDCLWKWAGDRWVYVGTSFAR